MENSVFVLIMADMNMIMSFNIFRETLVSRSSKYYFYPSSQSMIFSCFIPS